MRKRAWRKMVKSKTFWFNLITGALVVTDQLTGKVIPAQYSASIVAIGNVILRYLTTKPINEK
jgi:uncharacterized membrane protein